VFVIYKILNSQNKIFRKKGDLKYREDSLLRIDRETKKSIRNIFYALSKYTLPTNINTLAKKGSKNDT
jgi:hypothetical protein